MVIVDDQEPFRRAARAVVSRIEGFAVVGEAASAEEGIAIVDDLQPDLVLMDVNLPGMNGIEATQHVVAAHPEVGVVLVSTYDAADLPAGFDSCGALGYLPKARVRPGPLRELWDARAR